ncbi:MAG: helix-turn-helix domain-containing protein [Archaeoglobaceae archaeon]
MIKDLLDISEYLMKLGLSKKETEIYLSLLSTGPKTGMELSKYTKDPAPFVYRVLKRLENRKLVFRISENPMIFKAYPLDIVLSQLLSEKEREFKLLLSAKDTILQLYELQRNKVAGNLDFVVINGITNMIYIIGKMIERANYEVRNMISHEGIERIKCWHILEYERAVSRGVKVKIITSVDPLKVPTEILKISDLRFLKIPIDARFVISDDRELVIITTHEKNEVVSIYSKNKSLIKTLTEVYDFIWNLIA